MHVLNDRRRRIKTLKVEMEKIVKVWNVFFLLDFQWRFIQVHNFYKNTKNTKQSNQEIGNTNAQEFWSSWKRRVLNVIKIYDSGNQNELELYQTHKFYWFDLPIPFPSYVFVQKEGG